LVWFDFHAECRGGRWAQLAGLSLKARPFLEADGCFVAVKAAAERGGGGGRSRGGTLGGGGARQWVVAAEQRGVVRTNCIDCLDRTNVAQVPSWTTRVRGR
jgi:hypothetical protein